MSSTMIHSEEWAKRCAHGAHASVRQSLGVKGFCTEHLWLSPRMGSFGGKMSLPSRLWGSAAFLLPISEAKPRRACKSR
jgi:hypothetical protein